MSCEVHGEQFGQAYPITIRMRAELEVNRNDVDRWRFASGDVWCLIV